MSLSLCCVDYWKAFDIVIRNHIHRILRHYGMPQSIVKLIECMHGKKLCWIIGCDELTDGF